MTFVPVALHPQGQFINLPMINGKLKKETLLSQYPGATGLKYQLNGIWTAVEIEGNEFVLPVNGGKYIVVTNAVDNGYQILSSTQNLASRVSRVFSRAGSTTGTFSPQASAAYRSDINAVRTDARFCHRNIKITKKRGFCKTYKVSFIKDGTMPTPLSRSIVLMDGMITVTSADDEMKIKTNLVQILNSNTNFIFTVDQLRFLTCGERKLSVPHVSSDFVWNGENVRTNVGQGKMYVQVISKEGQSQAEMSEVNSEQEDEVNTMQESSRMEKSSTDNTPRFDPTVIPLDLKSDSASDFEDSSTSATLNRRRVRFRRSLRSIDYGCCNDQSRMTEMPTDVSVCRQAPINNSTVPETAVSETTSKSEPGTSVPILSSFHTDDPVDEDTHMAVQASLELVHPKRRRPLRRAALRFQQTLGLSYSNQHTGHTSAVNAPSRNPEVVEVIDSEDEEIQQVLDASLVSSPAIVPVRSGDIQILLRNFQGKLNKFDKQEIIVYRRKILESAFRALRRPSFDVECKLYVKFSGELGLDHGGPRREFFRFAMRELASSALFEGTEEKIFSHNLQALEQEKYRWAGKLVGMSLAQEGPGMGFLNKEVFLLMAGADPQLQDFSIHLVPDTDVRHILQELSKVDSEDMRDSILSKHGDWMVDQGVSSVWNLKISDIPVTVHTLVKQHIFYRTAAEIDQFKKGLDDVLGLMNEIKKDPTAWQALFCDMGEALTKEAFLGECEKSWSAEGSNRRILEEETIYSFEVFLQEIQEKTVPVSFSDLLAFITGAEKIPPLGFGSKIEVQFFDQERNAFRLPYVSTCALNISLPRGTDPEKLKDLMVRALKESQGFGKC